MTIDTDNFKWHAPNRGGNPGKGSHTSGVYVSINKGGDNKPQLTIRLYSNTMKKMRWVCGDRLQVGIDVENFRIALRRVPSGGYLASASGSTKADRANNIGSSKTSVIKLRAQNDIYALIDSGIEISIDDVDDVDGVLIVNLAK